jgi:hypothetical protein
MRTTVRLDEALLSRAKAHAAREHRTLTSLVEEGLTLVLERPRREPRKRVVLPISTADGGVRPGVDLNSNAALLDLLDEP